MANAFKTTTEDQQPARYISLIMFPPATLMRAKIYLSEILNAYKTKIIRLSKLNYRVNTCSVLRFDSITTCEMKYLSQIITSTKG